MSNDPSNRKRLEVPLFANPDHTHCFQASLRMVLKYYMPDRDYTWNELDNLTGKKEGLWTWPLFAMIQLKARGFDVIDIEDFDYNKFSK